MKINKKIFLLVISLLMVLFITACGNETAIDPSDSTNSHTEAGVIKNNDKEPEEDKTEVAPLTWPEITEDGVNEQLFMENLDTELLEKIAGEIQAIVEEEAEAERENPDVVLAEGWVRVFQTKRYKDVLSLGESAMKPLYWIIYKSPNAGMYEYICATALYEISGYDFTKEDGTLTWQTSKEFLERFNEKILSE